MRRNKKESFTVSLHIIIIVVVVVFVIIVTVIVMDVIKYIPRCCSRSRLA
jgi:hypothetical protein